MTVKRMRFFIASLAVLGVFILSCNKGEPRDRDRIVEGKDEDVRLRFGNEDLVLTTSTVSNARVAKLLPTKPSEDVSNLLLIKGPAATSKPTTDHDEYLPHESVEWVITVELPGKSRLNPKRINELFDANWRTKHGHFTSYGLDADTGRWTLAIAADGPRAITGLKLAWHFLKSSPDDFSPTTALHFEQRQLEVARQLEVFGTAKSQVSLPPIEAAKRAMRLQELKTTLDQSAVLVLKAPLGRKFDGKAIWDAMLCLGLQWGDMDCFHLKNAAHDGDDSYFSVETSTAPGYFLPEEIASGKLHVDDLVFGFSVPRSQAPAAIFDSMVKAVEYCKRRLGGRIQDGRGQKADLQRMRDRIVETERRLRNAGFVPGSYDTLLLF